MIQPCLLCMAISTNTQVIASRTSCKGLAIISSRRGGGRHQGGGPKFYLLRGRGYENKEHLKEGV